MCRPSTVTDDWVVKGCHIHLDGVELAVRPAHSPTYRGGFVFKKVFRSTSDAAFQAAVRKAREECLTDPAVRARWRRALQGGMAFVRSFTGEPAAASTSSSASSGTSTRTRSDMATLERFLRTGELGPLHPGMTFAEVIDLLGPPQDESVARRPRILKYGALQLTFVQGPDGGALSLASIGLYFAPPAEAVPAPAQPADFNTAPETTLAEMHAFLARVGLGEAALIEGDGTTYLVLPSGARITFDGQTLHSIHFAARATAPAKKQISVSIPEDTWDRLRTLARQTKRSVSELCAEWITQRADAAQPAGADGAAKSG